MTDLHQAEAAAREADAEVVRLGKTNKKSAWLHALAVASTTQRDLLAALDAARGEAVAWRWPKGNWRDGEPSVYDIKELQLHALAPELAYAAPPAALADAPRVERYGDGVLVHWPEGVEQYVQVSDCVTGKLAAPPGRDETHVDIGGESVPRWVVEHADALTTYYAERGGGSWAIGGVQSREQAPPAAAVSADVLALLRDLAPALDAYERSGRKIEIKGGALHWTLDARHYDAQRLRSRVEAMLTAAERAKGVES